MGWNCADPLIWIFFFPKNTYYAICGTTDTQRNCRYGGGWLENYTQIFGWVGFGAPNPCVVQGSTVFGKDSIFYFIYISRLRNAYPGFPMYPNTYFPSMSRLFKGWQQVSNCTYHPLSLYLVLFLCSCFRECHGYFAFPHWVHSIHYLINDSEIHLFSFPSAVRNSHLS